jgi:hypothetical protein
MEGTLFSGLLSSGTFHAINIVKLKKLDISFRDRKNKGLFYVENQSSSRDVLMQGHFDY